jgi:hypothetical protein
MITLFSLLPVYKNNIPKKYQSQRPARNRKCAHSWAVRRGVAFAYPKHIASFCEKKLCPSPNLYLYLPNTRAMAEPILINPPNFNPRPAPSSQCLTCGTLSLGNLQLCTSGEIRNYGRWFQKVSLTPFLLITFSFIIASASIKILPGASVLGINGMGRKRQWTKSAQTPSYT